MSVMTAVLGPRTARARLARTQARPAGGAADGAGREATLADLVKGQNGVVVGVSDEEDPTTARRLVDLGFVPGTEVQMLRRAPLADPVVFRVAGYDIALRRAQARCVRVDTTP